MQNELKFKISSALKNIIGSDLINDDFIAVFELVKNSYDAHATKVEVIFENIYGTNPKIIIKDNGKGMDYNDLVNKWLFVAYSAKVVGEEDKDYRDKIKVKRAFAGAKGIGRFSCDRLGKNLYLETIKDKDQSQVEALIIDWSKFENDIQDEFINISVLQETLTSSNYNISHGTVLEITDLKSTWSREKLINLKNALARLINPNSLSNEDEFKIFIQAKEESRGDEIQKDKNLKSLEKQKEKNLKILDNKKFDDNFIEYFNIVNGEVKNLIFEVLDLKTTLINSKVERGKIITTLYEGGKLVYQIEEKNLLNNLTDIEYSIYFLNTSAKATFSRRMGVQPVEYGHIFVYKNGLRVFPYGERGEDPLKMDNRKAQGYSRYLGTRDVIGFISITGINNNLKETSSRGDGLIKTQTYFELEKWFYETLKRLELYSIEITNWGSFLSDDDFINLNNYFTKNQGTDYERVNDVNANLEKLIKTISRGNNIIDFKISDEILSILEKKSENSVKSELGKISKKIRTENFDKYQIIDEINKVDKKIDGLHKSTIEAQEESIKLEDINKRLEKENTETEKELEIEKKKNTYLSSKKTILSSEAEGLVHHIQIFNVDIRDEINRLIPKILKNELSNVLIVEQLLKIKKLTEKTIAISNLITGAGFNLKVDKQSINIPVFINDYISKYYEFHDKGSLELKCEGSNIPFYKLISLLELSIILDNIISNSRKWGAKQIRFQISNDVQENLLIDISDDGFGLSPKLIDNPNQIFELGITESAGSGIGLHYVKNLLKNMNAKISFTGNNVRLNGANFQISFLK